MQLYDRTMYIRHECAVFLKTTEQFGGLSNMAGGYPLFINGIQIPTAEAIYQACRFPHMPELQKIIIGQKSPMTAKMKSKPFRNQSRPDWDDIKVEVMYWCLKVKLVQNLEKFSHLLLSTNTKYIVEESYRDQFWGAKPIDNDRLFGSNVLGKLLVELRDELQKKNLEEIQIVFPLSIPQFLLVNKPIEVIKARQDLVEKISIFSLIEEQLQANLDMEKVNDHHHSNIDNSNNQGSVTFQKNILPIPIKDVKQGTFDFMDRLE